jgi:signal-transduction protein with cAMP-binding, CBS, and nucleotidyltransferase domain
MTRVMESLQIRFFEKGEVIARELDECNEVLFVYHGRYIVGYEVNNYSRFRKQFGYSTIIGGFQICFQRRFIFTYKAHTDLVCYAIKRKDWYSITKQFPDYLRIVKQKLLKYYFEHVYTPLMKYKRSDIEEFEKRHDYNQILATKDPSSQEIQDSIEENSKEFLRQILERKQEQ